MRGKVAQFQERTAPEVEAKDESWFLDQLERHCQEVVQHGSDFNIHCPNPAHNDTNPSCGVDRHSGRFHCFACNIGGSWNYLASLIGAERLGRVGSRDEPRLGRRSSVSLKDDMTRALTRAGVKDNKKYACASCGERLKQTENGWEHTYRTDCKRPRPRVDTSRPIVTPWSAHEDWRSVSGSTLTSLSCVKVVDLKRSTVRIGLPVKNIDGGLLGYTCRVLSPEDAEPRYLPLAADAVSWRSKELPVSEALFLADQVLRRGWDRVVLVEGPYDALRLYSQGVPALAILGAGSWTAKKRALLAGLGLDAVLVVMDNDEAGQDCQRSVIADLSPITKCKGLNLPPSIKDPGGLSNKQCSWVRQKLEEM